MFMLLFTSVWYMLKMDRGTFLPQSPECWDYNYTLVHTWNILYRRQGSSRTIRVWWDPHGLYGIVGTLMCHMLVPGFCSWYRASKHLWDLLLVICRWNCLLGDKGGSQVSSGWGLATRKTRSLESGRRQGIRSITMRTGLLKPDI